MSVSSNLESEKRLATLNARLETQGSVKIGVCAVELGVSEMTIRRDLAELEGLGLARRVRGGAVAVGPVSLDGRRQTRANSKAKIAAKLRPLVPAVGAIGLDASTTILRLAGALDRAHDLIVVTNGTHSFSALQGKPGVRPLLTGGFLEPHIGSLIGPLACQGASSLVLNRLFLSAAAVDATLGTTETTMEVADVKKAMASMATDVVVAVDSSKLDQRALAPGVAWSSVSLLVTELSPDDPRLERYRTCVEVR